MRYICVRTYGNGRFMNKVYNMCFDYLSQAEYCAKKLNNMDAEDGDKWIAMPMNDYVGPTWPKDDSE